MSLLRRWLGYESSFCALKQLCSRGYVVAWALPSLEGFGQQCDEVLSQSDGYNLDALTLTHWSL